MAILETAEQKIYNGARDGSLRNMRDNFTKISETLTRFEILKQGGFTTRSGMLCWREVSFSAMFSVASSTVQESFLDGINLSGLILIRYYLAGKTWIIIEEDRMCFHRRRESCSDMYSIFREVLWGSWRMNINVG
jgi:hypothetical protein